MTNNTEEQSETAALEPIQSPTRKQQYRAIGLLMARYIPSSEGFKQGILMTQDGALIDAVVKGQMFSLVKSKIDLDKEHIWVVYPKTPKEEFEIPLHVQIAGIWEPETLHPELETPKELQFQVDEFSVQGEVVYQDFVTGKVIVKIRQSPRIKGEPPKFFKLKLQGYLPPKSLKRFWEFKVRRVGTDLLIQSGEYIAQVVDPSKKPFGKKPFNKKKGRRPQGNKKFNQKPNQQPKQKPKKPTSK